MKALATSWKHEPFGQGVELVFHATFNAAELARIEAGLVPRQMEDKWFIFYDAPYLHFHRSWTGLPVYRVKLDTNPHGAKVVEALLSQEQRAADAPDLNYHARLLDFLISNLLLRQSKPFPRPAGMVEPAPGVFQHHIAGTGYREAPPAASPPSDSSERAKGPKKP